MKFGVIGVVFFLICVIDVYCFYGYVVFLIEFIRFVIFFWKYDVYKIDDLVVIGELVYLIFCGFFDIWRNYIMVVYWICKFIFFFFGFLLFCYIYL